MELFTAARKNGETVSDAKLVLQATGNMGLIHSALKQWEQAEQVYRAMVAQSESLGDTRIIGISTKNLSTVLWESKGPTDEALGFARRALAIKLQFGDKVSIAQSAINIAGLLCDRHEYLEARQALADAKAWVKQAAAKPPAFYLALNRAQFFTSLDNTFRDDAAGFVAYDEAIRLAQEIGMLEEEARAHEHAKAYAHLEQCLKLREKYLAEQSTRQIEKMRQAYELDRLEQEHGIERMRREELETLNAQLTRTAGEATACCGSSGMICARISAAWWAWGN